MFANVTAGLVRCFRQLQRGRLGSGHACGTTWATRPRPSSCILFIMSAWSLGVMIDRALMYSAARKQSRVFVQQVAGALKDRQARRSDLHRRAQQEEPHRQGCGHGPFRVPVRFGAGVATRK